MEDHPDHHDLEDDQGFDDQPKPRELPADLPRSLDDRKAFSGYGNVETEYYDAWQGMQLPDLYHHAPCLTNKSARPVPVSHRSHHRPLEQL